VKENDSINVDWRRISEFSLRDAEEGAIHVRYVKSSWYGKSHISGDVHKPTTEIRVTVEPSGADQP
jgi:hypothetical protein